MERTHPTEPPVASGPWDPWAPRSGTRAARPDAIPDAPPTHFPSTVAASPLEPSGPPGHLLSARLPTSPPTAPPAPGPGAGPFGTGATAPGQAPPPSGVAGLDRVPVADDQRPPGVGPEPPTDWPAPRIPGPVPGSAAPRSRTALAVFVAFLAGALVVGAAFGTYALGDRHGRGAKAAAPTARTRTSAQQLDIPLHD